MEWKTRNKNNKTEKKKAHKKNSRVFMWLELNYIHGTRRNNSLSQKLKKVLQIQIVTLIYDSQTKVLVLFHLQDLVGRITTNLINPKTSQKDSNQFGGQESQINWAKLSNNSPPCGDLQTTIFYQI